MKYNISNCFKSLPKMRKSIPLHIKADKKIFFINTDNLINNSAFTFSAAEVERINEYLLNDFLKYPNITKEFDDFQIKGDAPNEYYYIRVFYNKYHIFYDNKGKYFIFDINKLSISKVKKLNYYNEIPEVLQEYNNNEREYNSIMQIILD